MLRLLDEALRGPAHSELDYISGSYMGGWERSAHGCCKDVKNLDVTVRTSVTWVSPQFRSQAMVGDYLPRTISSRRRLSGRTASIAPNNVETGCQSRKLRFRSVGSTRRIPLTFCFLRLVSVHQSGRTLCDRSYLFHDPRKGKRDPSQQLVPEPCTDERAHEVQERMSAKKHFGESNGRFGPPKGKTAELREYFAIIGSHSRSRLLLSQGRRCIILWIWSSRRDWPSSQHSHRIVLYTKAKF